MYGIPKSVCVVPVIPVCVWMSLPYVLIVFLCRKLSPHLRVLELDHGCLLSLCCVIFNTMWPGKSLQLLCIVPFCMLCLSAISMMFVKIMLAVCMLVDMVV